jgi:hypothetical protein
VIETYPFCYQFSIAILTKWKIKLLTVKKYNICAVEKDDQEWKIPNLICKHHLGLHGHASLELILILYVPMFIMFYMWDYD